MNLRPSRRLEPDVNLTPLIDVVFLLLIFFMVSTTFRKESELKIDLPEASPQPSTVAEQQPLEIAIDASGRYFINGQALADEQAETLKEALAKQADIRRDESLIIRADAETPHQAVVTAMDVAGQLGFKHLAIPTLRQPNDRHESVSDK
jgi:biopolymer transport protein ExbD